MDRLGAGARGRRRGSRRSRGSSRAPAPGRCSTRLVGHRDVQRARRRPRSRPRPCATPSRRAVRMTRQAISPRLAIRILRNIGVLPRCQAACASRGTRRCLPCLRRRRGCVGDALSARVARSGASSIGRARRRARISVLGRAPAPPGRRRQQVLEQRVARRASSCSGWHHLVDAGRCRSASAASKRSAVRK